MNDATRAQLIAVRQKLIESELRLQEATKIMNHMFEFVDVGEINPPKARDQGISGKDPVEEACLE